MTTSTDVDIIETDWTNITLGVSAGFFTNNSRRNIAYREAPTATAPLSTVEGGHVLESLQGERFSSGAGQTVYARSRNGLAVVTVTED